MQTSTVTSPVTFLQSGSNTIAIAIVAIDDTQLTSYFDTMVRLMSSEQSESHIWEFTASMSGITGTATNPFDMDYSSYIYSYSCAANSLTVTLSNNRREWISSVQIQNYYYYSYRNQVATQFNLYGRNSDTDEWTLLKEVTGLTYSISGQKRRIYFSNNTPYNQFKFENFGTGNPSSCWWEVQSLDLFADNVLVDIPNFTYDSPITVFKDVEMSEVIPQNGDRYMNFRINPSLPAGIVLDPHTGWISGTATSESTTQTYTITATKISGGDVTDTISLSVSVCTGGKGLMTVRIRADGLPSENSWKLYEGRGTSGTVLRSVSEFPVSSAYYYVDFCLNDGIYTFEGSDSYGDGWNIGSGYTLTVDYGEMELDIMEMNRQDYKPIYVSTVFSTYFPFQIEYTDWKVIQSDVSSDWNTVSFDDSTWNTYKAVDIPSTSSITTYIRKSFTMSGVNDYQVLNVRVKYSGGVAAYLNGNLVARFNLEDDFDSTTLSITDHDASVFSKFHVILSTAGIQEGSNVFSFEIHRGLSGSSSDPVVFDATGVFGVEDCSTVVDSYSSITSNRLSHTALADIMDLDPFTTGRLPNTIGTYIEWTVENLEGSKWNSFNILGSYTVSSWGFDIYGYSNPDDEQESVTILNAVNQTVTSRTKPQIAVPVALAGFCRYRWQITDTDSNSLCISSIHMAYCKDPRYNDPNWTPVPTPTPIPTSTLIPTTIPPTTPPPAPSDFIASSDWDSIPLNVQSLIFDSNSFPDMIDVDLSNFTSLQSLQFREGSFASASSLTIIGYHIFLYSFIGLTQLNTILFHNHSFPITHSIILQDLSVHSIQVGEDCFNGIGSFEGRRLDSTSIAKLTLKNNGMLQEMKIPAGSFTQIKNIEMSNLQNLKMIEIEGEKGEKGAPFQSTSSFVTNGTPNLEVMKLGNKVCQSGSVFSIDSKMIKEVEIGKKCFQGTDKESQYGAKAQQFVMIDQPKLISTKIDKSSFVYFDTYNLMNNPKQMIANVAYSKSISSFGRRLEDDDLPSFSGVKEIVMKNLTSLEETVFGKGSFPNVTVINLSELPVVKNITLEEGSFGKTEELILVSE